jgi:pimeloyl-ACP methyl ester carboxylesterase
MGFVVLRFDFSGIGDSTVRNDHLPFTESAPSETAEAMNHLQTTRGIRQFILMGLCSGALISFKTACRDPRVVGAVLINTWGHLHDLDDSELTSSLRNRALARHYWRIGLLSSFRTKNWLKVLGGKASYRSVIAVMLGSPLKHLLTPRRNASPGTDGTRADLRRLSERGVRLLHVYSEGDEGLDYFQMMAPERLPSGSTSGLLETEIIRGANHTFTLRWSQERLLDVIQCWAQETNRHLLSVAGG